MNLRTPFAAAATALAVLLIFPSPSAAQPAQPAQLVLPARSPAGSPLPRYRLEAGQRLIYTTQWRMDHDSGSLGSDAVTTVTVLARNGDGSWKVGGIRGTTDWQLWKDRPGSPAGPKEPTLAFDLVQLTPDGRTSATGSQLRSLELDSLFPPLPADEAEARGTWSVTKVMPPSTTVYKALPATDGPRMRLAGEQQDPGNAVYLSSSFTTATIDLEVGIPERVEIINTQGYGFVGVGWTTSSLTSVERVPEAELGRYAEEAERIARILAEQSELADAADAVRETSETVNERFGKTRAQLQTASAEVQSPLLRKFVEDRLKSLADSQKSALNQVQERKKFVGKPAADWQLPDTAGTTHTLQDYRGKVVLLDFWYRGCGWCIFAMPDVKKVAEHYAGRPVAVLGINTDTDPADARFVVKKLGLNYTNLLAGRPDEKENAEGLPEKYGVRGFPTLLVVDRKGIIRDVHVGYSPDLRENLIRSVDGLLKE